MTWPAIPLRHLGQVFTGSTPRTSETQFFGGEIPFVTPSDLDGDCPILITPRTLSEAGLREARELPKNTILVCCIGSLGKVGIAGRNLATNQQINSVVFDENRIFPRFGFYAVRRLKPVLESMAPATTVAIVSKSKFEGLEIPVPPLPDQRRIAAILDQADALRRKRREALERLNRLTHAIFIEMFGDPSEVFEHGKPLGNLAALINGDRSGNYPSGDDLVESGIPFLNTKTINDGRIDLSAANFITARKFRSLSRGKLKRHDLIITLRGSLGQCAEFDVEPETGFINAQMMIIRPGARLRPKYIKEYITSPKVQVRLIRESSGSAVPQLTGKQIGDLTIFVPPIAQQEQFDIQVAMVNEIKSKNQRHFNYLDSLFASLQHRAFCGEL